jgi:hypothetical protein
MAGAPGCGVIQGMNSDRIGPVAALERLKRHPVAIVATLVVTIVLTLSSFTDAARNLAGLWRRTPVVVPDGTWVTPELANPFAAEDRFHLEIELASRGEIVTGVLRKVGSGGRYEQRRGLEEGRLAGTDLSFAVREQSLVGSEVVTYLDRYQGTLTGEDSLSIMVRSERPWPYPPQSFVAVRRRP